MHHLLWPQILVLGTWNEAWNTHTAYDWESNLCPMADLIDANSLATTRPSNRHKNILHGKLGCLLRMQASQEHIRKNSTTLSPPPPPLRSVPRCKIGILGRNPPFQKLFKKMVAFFFFRSSPPFSKPTVFAQNLTPVLNREFYFWGRFGEICKLCIYAMFILTPWCLLKTLWIIVLQRFMLIFMVELVLQLNET